MRITTPYPLLLRPILFEKVWGGRRLERLGMRLAAGKQIGESWEVADLPATSPSGGGGSAARSVIENGPLAGKTLHDALEAWGDRLLGAANPTASGEFPLLVKYLDARENLSVQVHPSPEFARANPWAHLKTECWYVVEAEPGSVIYAGAKPGVTSADLERALRAGGDRVPELLEARPAVPGECHLLPSGTVHALGAGVVVAEVQTPSDTTFRLYDWGRTGREMHIEQAIECLQPSPAPAPVPAGGRVRTSFFTFEAADLGRGAGFASDQCGILLVVRGQVTLHDESTKAPPMVRGAGATIVLPAAVAVSTRLSAAAGSSVLRVVVGEAL